VISIEVARGHYRDADSAHDFDHVLRVLALAERIATPEGANLRVVRAAALLHDVGRSRARAEGLDHAQLGATMARVILAGRAQADVRAVAEAIRTHRFRSGPRPATLEARVLFDADKLDALGAVGIARAFAHGGAHGQRLWAPVDEVDADRWAASGDDPDEHTPVHEFVVKLSKLRELLYTAAARRLAEDRHAYMVSFFARLGAEVQGEL
jgi:uncharacterized protein